MEKHMLQAGDIIGLNDLDAGYEYFRVIKVNKKTLSLLPLEDSTDGGSYTVPIPYEDDYYPPVTVDYEALRSFCRYDIPFTALLKEGYPAECLLCDTQYRATAEDLIALTQNCRGKTAETVYQEWVSPTGHLLDGIAVFGEPDTDEQQKEYHFLPSESAQLYLLYLQLVKAVFSSAGQIFIAGDGSPMEETLSSIEQAAKTLLADRDKPLTQRTYTEKVKENFITAIGANEKELNAVSDAELNLYRRFVDDLCLTGNRTALTQKAYACYGGNRAYPCDWIASRDLLLQLTKENADPFHANTLGYIYYYGRCSEGKPEHDKAFYWFSIGAAGGVYESRYKLADMFIRGYGVPKSESIALELLTDVYNRNLEHIRNEHFDCKFADAALRIGNLFRDGIAVTKSANSAYHFYLQAEYAIRKRREIAENFGDGRVESNIRKAIEDVLPETDFTELRRSIVIPSLTLLLHDTVNNGRVCEAKIKRLSSGEYSIRIRPVARPDDEETPKLFITVPPAHLCGIFPSVTVKTKDIEDICLMSKTVLDGEETVFFTSVERDPDMNVDFFSLYGEEVMIIDSRYTFTVPKEKTASKKSKKADA